MRDSSRKIFGANESQPQRLKPQPSVNDIGMAEAMPLTEQREPRSEVPRVLTGVVRGEVFACVAS